MTSVTSNTILSSASSLFTFALSIVFLKEPFTAAKLVSIAACIGGAHGCGGEGNTRGAGASRWQSRLPRL